MMRITGQLAAVAVVALLAGACDSGSPSASNTTPSTGDPAQAAFKFARCMRNHGVSNFSDPVISQQAGVTTVTIKRPAGSSLAPTLQAARQACRGILSTPHQIAAVDRAREPDLLAFARCMRRHSVADFPDPTSQGQLTLEMLASAGVDVGAPNVLSAAKTCLPASNGAITPADIQRAVSGEN